MTQKLTLQPKLKLGWAGWIFVFWHSCWQSGKGRDVTEVGFLYQTFKHVTSRPGYGSDAASAKINLINFYAKMNKYYFTTMLQKNNNHMFTIFIVTKQIQHFL